MAILYDSQNVVVGEAALFLQVYNPSTPPVWRPDTTALFAAATAPWVSVGGTDDGFKINLETSTTTINIEEQALPVAETVESRKLGIEASLAEDTLESMIWAWGSGQIATTAAGSGTWGKKTLTLTNTLLIVAAILETRNKFGYARRYNIPRMSSVGGGTTSFRRAADKRMYDLKLSSVCELPEVSIVELTAPAT